MSFEEVYVLKFDNIYKKNALQYYITLYYVMCDPGIQTQSLGYFLLLLRFIHNMKAAYIIFSLIYGLL